MQTFGIGSVLRTSMRVWQQNFVAFSLLALVMYTPALVARLVMPAIDDQFLLTLPFDILVDSLVAASVTYGVIMELHGTRPSHRECVRRGLAQLGPALGVSFVSMLAVIGGLFLLVVPGIIIALMLWVVVPVVVTEKPGVMEALRHSRELTHGHKATLLIVALVIWSVSGAAAIALEDVYESYTLAFVLLGVEALTGLFAAITAAVVYMQLRQLKEGAQVPQIAQAFAVVRTR